MSSNSGILTTANKLIFILIFVGLAAQILETEPQLADAYTKGFLVAEYILMVIFTIEYMLRVWSIPENPEYIGKHGRLRYLGSKWAIIDLIAIIPSYLMFLSFDLVWLRTLRVLRLLKLMQFSAFGGAFWIIGRAVREKAFELSATFAIANALLLFSATCLYFIEGDLQPEVFGSIPRAMWWSVATLTTVGYGDVYPVTALGRIFAGFTAMIGIGIIAMPTGILAAALSNAFSKENREK